MGSKNVVTHTGVVKETGTKGIKVDITVLSGCASCQIKGSCSMAEQTNKELEIECDPAPFKTGQKVLVKLQTHQGFRALFLGYLLPFIILVTVMIILSTLIENEATVGLISLASIIPYYIAIYVLRNKIKKKFTYVVNPLND
ncbi:MAG: SoxR reducing system RseC family protein [Prolixibacteraceae bacterium]|nr:SoxR reducing system RseC family protein [Prolixibacteraceae bacterium]